VTTWSQTYSFADRLEHREFFPLAKHLVEPIFRENKENMLAQPYFGDQYVGLGPFKVVSWDHGSSIELVANENYFLGRPKLDRIRVLIIPDPSTAIANMQAGAVNVFLPTGGPDYDQLKPLGDIWKSDGKGEVIPESIRWRFMEPQKSALAQPAELRDPRMRQALLTSVNRQELTRSLLGDLGTVADSWVHPRFSEYPQVKDSITVYAYDQRRAQERFAELGYTPGADGILQRAGTPLKTTISYEQDQEKEGTIIRQDLRSVGVDADLVVVPNVMLRDAEYRASYTGLQLSQNPMGTLSAVRRFAGDQIPTSNNRFAGTNRGSFSNADWDDVGVRLRTALEDDERLALEKELLQVYSYQLPALPVHYEIQAVPVQGFKGLQPISGVPHTGNIMHTTNAYQWELK
jgi:peptide/nickel transport system substrate-binding protein